MRQPHVCIIVKINGVHNAGSSITYYSQCNGADLFPSMALLISESTARTPALFQLYL